MVDKIWLSKNYMDAMNTVKKMFNVIEFSPVQAKKKKLLFQYHNSDFDSQRISAQY